MQYKNANNKTSKTGEPIFFLLHYLSFCYDSVRGKNSTTGRTTDAMVLSMLTVCVLGATNGMRGFMFYDVLPQKVRHVECIYTLYLMHCFDCCIIVSHQRMVHSR